MITCYATPGKVKASRLCESFAIGINAAGGSARLSPCIPQQLADGAAAFYGVTAETRHLWRQAIAEGRDWYYIDNSYFDATRGTHYRITRNALQFRSTAHSDGTRRAALGLTVAPWREGQGRTVLICEQSPLFMQHIVGNAAKEWQKQVQQFVALHPGKVIKTRPWNANKKVAADSLPADLDDAAAVITWGSSAAVEALLKGITVHVSPQSAAYGVAPPYRDGWANVLADKQWTLNEISNGTAWRSLQGNPCLKAG